MILFHAGLLEDAFLLWAEAKAAPPPRERGSGPGAPPAEGSSGPGAASGGAGRSGTPCAVHPFAAGRSRMRQALIQAGLKWITPGKPQVVAAWLPSTAGRPLPSSPLVGEAPEEDEPPGPGEAAGAGAGEPAGAPGPDMLAAPRLLPWRVEALALAASDLVELLAACAVRRPLAPGVAAGPELSYWTGVLAFAASLAARERYLPGAVQKNGSFLARWEPVFNGPDAGVLERLQGELPAVSRCLAAVSNGAASPPQEGPRRIISVFVGQMVDHLVRGSLTGFRSSTATHRQSLKPGELASLHDCWMYALKSPDPVMRWDAVELQGFVETLLEWRRPVWLTAASPFRLCFRLEEPEAEPGQGGPAAGSEEPETGAGEGEPEAGLQEPAGLSGGRAAAQAMAQAVSGPWTLRFLLQSREDLSLLVPAAEAWQAGRSSVLRRSGFRPREFLLSCLGQAAAIYPRIASSLEEAAPSLLELDAAGAYRFLTGVAGPLEEAGFGVMLPGWWTGRGARERPRLRAAVKSPRMQAPGALSLEELVHVEWEVALGDQAVSLEELRALAELKAPLVQVRGKWVEINSSEIEAILARLRGRRQKVALGEVLRMALGAPTAVAARLEEDLDGVRATGWVERLLRQLEGESRFEELASPPGFRGTLRPYQLKGYSWLDFLKRWGLGACLADDMGLGKTVQALALIQRSREQGERRPVLLVCPTSVMNNWLREAARFTPELPVMVHHGPARPRGGDFAAEAGEQAMVVTSYALLQRDVAHLREVQWSGAILDEAQNIKNPDTLQARAARSLAAGYRMALTGTPVENNVGDLWSIMEFLNPGFLGSRAEFRRRFFLPIQAYGNRDALRRLRRVVGPFILRRLKTDRSVISDLPEKMEMDVFCSLTREQASLYAAVVRELEGQLEQTEGMHRRGAILAALMKLKQVCNHPAQFLKDGSPIPGRSGKLARLTEMIEELLAAADRALVFTQFAEMGEILKRHLEETFAEPVLFLHGGVSSVRRDRMVELFQSGDGPAVFVLSLKAGGTGLNLTRASHVFHFDRWWNPAVENQATDRAFRIGQKRNVQVHKLVCAGTLEERIGELIAGKQELAGRLVGSGEAWLTELSNRELREVFALRKEAVRE